MSRSRCRCQRCAGPHGPSSTADAPAAARQPSGRSVPGGDQRREGPWEEPQARSSRLNLALPPLLQWLRLVSILAETLEEEIQHFGILFFIRDLVAGIVMCLFRTEILHHDAPITVMHSEITRRF